MKTVLYNVLLLFIVPIVFTQCEKEPEPNKITILDDNFLNALIELGVDANGDSIISPAEAEIITYLDVSYNNISDLTGIEAFINLDTLNCHYNDLTSLDVSNNTRLTYLYCSSNQLTSLDVSTNTELTWLKCGGNLLSSLDISNNSFISILDIKEMPSLYEVCVWEMPFPPIGVNVYTDGSPNVYFTTECSGGN